MGGSSFASQKWYPSLIPIGEEVLHILLEESCLLQLRYTPVASFSLQVLSFAMKTEWYWNFQAIWAPKNGMHLWWVGHVDILTLVLVGRPGLKASPIFQVNRIHAREQLASNYHDALGVSDLHDTTKSGRPCLSSEMCLLSESPGNSLVANHSISQSLGPITRWDNKT